ncbi:hypothetical protein, partial [Escherichia coli]|uniref:hypothetical protein n=1 Tax=Escherichia coli TaxID=562 RepID=UPI0032196548
EDTGSPTDFALTAVRTGDLFRPKRITKKIAVVALEFIHLIGAPASPVAAAFDPHEGLLLRAFRTGG